MDKKFCIKTFFKSYYHLIPMMLLIAIVPLITFLKITNLPKDSVDYLAYPLGTKNYDFFSYYKAIGIIILAPLSMMVTLIKRGFYKDKFIIILLILALCFGISTIMSPFLPVALKGVSDRYEGVATLISYILITISTIGLIETKKELLILLGSGLFSLLIISAIGVGQFYGFDILQTDFGKKLILPSSQEHLVKTLRFKFNAGWIYSTFYNPNYGGSISVIFIAPIVVSIFYVKKKKNLIGLFILYSFVFFLWFGCQSRAGLYSGMGTLIVFILFKFRLILRSYKRVIILIGLSATQLAFMTFLNPNYSLGNTLTLKGGVYNNIREIDQVNGFTVIQDKDSKLFIKGTPNNYGLSFYDENKNVIPLSIINGAFHLNNEKYKNYSFTRSKKPSNLYIMKYEEFQYELVVLKDGSIKTLGMRNKVIDIINPPRIKALDGYEAKGTARFFIWSRSLPLVNKTGLFGSGPDTFSLLFPQNDIFGKRLGFGGLIKNKNMFVDKPHNFFLQIILNTGIISFIIFFILTFWYGLESLILYFKLPIENLFQIVGIASAFGVLAFLMSGMFNDSSVSSSPYFWFLLGVGIKMNILNKKEAWRFTRLG